MPVTVRPLRADDSLDELTALLHRSYAALQALGFNYTAVDQTVDVTRERIDEGTCLVAVDGDLMVGTIVVYPVSRTAEWCGLTGAASFAQFAVSPEYQRGGVGSALLEEVERHAARIGAANIVLNTAEHAEALISWYARRGYAPVGHVQWEGKTYRSVVLGKELERATLVAESTTGRLA